MLIREAQAALRVGGDGQAINTQAILKLYIYHVHAHLCWDGARAREVLRTFWRRAMISFFLASRSFSFSSLFRAASAAAYEKERGRKSGGREGRSEWGRVREVRGSEWGDT